MFDGEDSGSGEAAVIAAGLAMAGQFVNNQTTMRFNKEEAEKQRAWSEYLVDKQNMWNENFWNKTNEYNSPSAQVERMREAGLNPLYYGLDGSSAGGLQSAQPTAYERASIGNLPNPVATGIDSAVRVAQIGNIQADTAKKNNENLTETQRREKLLADIDVTKQQLNNLLAQEDLTNAERLQIEKNLSWIDRLNEAVINEKDSSAALNDATRNRINVLLKGEKLLQSKSLEDFERRWAKIDAEIEKIVAETGIAKKDIEYYSLNHLQSGFAGTGISMNNLFRNFYETYKERHRLPGVVDAPPEVKGFSGVR